MVKVLCGADRSLCVKKTEPAGVEGETEGEIFVGSWASVAGSQARKAQVIPRASIGALFDMDKLTNLKKLPIQTSRG
jgi:hypothetical protein